MGDARQVTRRGFLGLVGTGAAALLAGCTRPAGKPTGPLEAVDFDPLDSYPYRGWESLYREQFTWDKVVRSTHSANCTGSCS
jgi:complex iron-sulfur molybdoenzyme family reductase subunit alpha